MNPGAYILINVATGEEINVVTELRRLPGVVNARVVTGLHDIVCYVEAPTIDELRGEIIGSLRHIPGITRTVTCLSFDGEA
jgi:DNA-binding Lrp family transcriptional regulator